MGSGVPRKYYTITPDGAHALNAMKQEWLKMSFAIQKLSL
jgi:DNA-binding PadR family transcriptional regulator